MWRTMERVRGGVGLGLILACLMVWACGDDDDNNNNGGGDAGSDIGGDGTGGDTQVAECETVNTQCFTPLPSAGTNPRLLIQSVQFGPVDEVVLKNVSADALDMTGFFICRNPTYEALPAMTLASTATVTVHLGVAGENSETDIFIEEFPALTAADEIAIYRSDDFESSSEIVAYVRWGSQASGFTRAPQAAAAGLWTATEFVPICGDNQGIIGTGDATLPIGFHDVPASCFD